MPLNRLACVTNALKEETKYTYDMNGNTLTQTDGNGNVITMEYNALNKLSRRIDMGGKTGADGKYTYEAEKTESYTYDSEGDLLAKRDRNGIVTSYTYDIHSRMTLQDAGGEKISYTYDNNGNQLSMTDSTGTTNRTYDELNRVTGKSITRLGTTTFQYDLAFNGADGYEDGYMGEKATDPKGNTTLKIYDKVGRLKVVKADGETTGTSYQYDENGNRVATAYDSGARAEYSFNKDNLLIGLTNKKPGGAVLDTYSYQYDTAHNQTQKTDPKGTTQYQYDSLNRLNYVLEPASLAGKLTQYTYDHAGNRLTETVTETDGATQKQKSSVTKYNYNEQNRLMTTEVTNEAGAKSVTKYVYDANGNLTAKSMETTKPYDPNTKPSFGMFIIGQDTSNLRPEIQAIAKSTAMYEYDHYNQLAVAKTSGGTSVYKYNGDGLRVEKEVNGTTTKYLYESDKIILELDGNGKEIDRNIYGTNLISKEVDGQKLSYMYNGHADVTSLIDGTGAVKNTYYYDAFGNVKEETGTAKNNITYAGYQYDKETGLYYLNSRMYDPVTARFMQEDTYRGQANDPLSLNLYTYCHNEPMMYTDPTGHYRALDDPGDKKVAPGKTRTTEIKTKTGTTRTTTSTDKNGKTTTKVETVKNNGAKTTSTKVSTNGKTQSLKVESQPAPKPTSKPNSPAKNVNTGTSQFDKILDKFSNATAQKFESIGKGVGEWTADTLKNFVEKMELPKYNISDMENDFNKLCADTSAFTKDLVKNIQTKNVDGLIDNAATVTANGTIVAATTLATDGLLGRGVPASSTVAEETLINGGQKAGSTAVAVYDPKFAARQLLEDGKVSVENLQAMVPKDAVNTFKPTKTITDGYKYNYTVNGTKIEIKWHAPDAYVATKFPESNSANGWTA